MPRIVLCSTNIDELMANGIYRLFGFIKPIIWSVIVGKKLSFGENVIIVQLTWLDQTYAPAWHGE